MSAPEYLARHHELQWRRLFENLSMKEEAGYAAGLDECWLSLTEAEQGEVEAALRLGEETNKTMSTLATLNLVDVPTTVGCAISPRRAI